MTPREALLAVLVLVHLGVSLAHGFAHARAGVELTGSQMLFVFAVILIGPVAGLVVNLFAFPRTGAWMIASTLAGALVFGLANHFVIPGVDHVSHVAGPYRVLFGVSAALLLLTEAGGAALAVGCATAGRRQRLAHAA